MQLNNLSRANAAPFAPMLRRTRTELEAEMARISRHQLVDTLLQAFHGVVMILNSERQILSINSHELMRLGIDAQPLTFGRRPGEFLGCVFAEHGLDGCGTGPACASCGAALALLACQQQHTVYERECLLTANLDGKLRDFEFLARCTPLDVDESTFFVLSLHDISQAKRLESLQDLFLHDMLNALTSLVLHTEDLCTCEHSDTVTSAVEIQRAVNHIREMTLAQRDLISMETGTFVLDLAAVQVADIITELRHFWFNAKVRQQRILNLPDATSSQTLHTDQRLLLRVLVNMIKNALEATSAGGTVEVLTSVVGETLVFSVHNPGQIPADVIPRVFQRSFSTKPGRGRGQGTYSMKLIGERYLGGSVTFVSEAAGTTFYLKIPLQHPGADPAQPESTIRS